MSWPRPEPTSRSRWGGGWDGCAVDVACVVLEEEVEEEEPVAFNVAGEDSG